MKVPGIEPVTSWLEVRHADHSSSEGVIIIVIDFVYNQQSRWYERIQRMANILIRDYFEYQLKEDCRKMGSRKEGNY